MSDMEEYKARARKARKYAHRTDNPEIRRLLLGLASDNEELLKMTFSPQAAREPEKAEIHS